MPKATLMRFLACAKANPSLPQIYGKERERTSQQVVYCLRLTKAIKKDGWTTYYYCVAIFN
jgi:hypothetical protein